MAEEIFQTKPYTGDANECEKNARHRTMKESRILHGYGVSFSFQIDHLIGVVCREITVSTSSEALFTRQIVLQRARMACLVIIRCVMQPQHQYSVGK